MTLRIPLVKNRFATLLSAYAPTLPSESEAKDSFYQSLDEALRRIPKNDKIFLLGDFNARVGQNSSIWSGVLGRHGVGQATTKLQRERVIELQYADDCALVSHNPQDLQSVLTAAVRAYSRMGLTVNTIKTEVVCQWSANIPSTPPTFTAAGEQLSVVPSFRYLGSILSEDNTIDNEVQNRIKQASAAFGRLRRRVFQNKNLHLRTKVCVYQAICITTLLYSCEAWVTYSRHIRALEQFHIRCLQRILGITWRDRVPHSEVLSKTNCRSIEATITQHQLRWLGHVVRMPSNRLPRRVLYGQLHHGRRSAGGQKKRYKDQLKTALKKCKIRPEALEDVAADRNTWRQLVQVVVGQLEPRVPPCDGFAKPGQLYLESLDDLLWGGLIEAFLRVPSQSCLEKSGPCLNPT
ncbi:hypothetical protein NHX12_025768 [Muraenolepis orangiensis]|uniref:Reverse transcriptase n=1 Tax=Muraenolepis orangiensis TaxID=630683 RepID=A0A9Q0EHA0_9TELE|nr:hypothetical protein NHX12_025768 [Muraenolepis orangiensis]